MLKKLIGSSATRSLAVVSVLKEAKRSLDRGKHLRMLVFLGIAVLAWKWAVIALVAQGLLSLIRGGDSNSRNADSSPV
ncbi:hypothetical protein G6M89_05725 [Natronolimnobius sp. AArcel1]|uniref:hypothetical protein n=1 Tax=Natronolimnobius sp. AArcel1 TaxID=1679093 RepID=UPI0013EB8A6C|nr:hypothetical protein [Natronolimnobius sp. AArcel1]NGM68514.1 hypothetical protein [Natronolimnobius sp. AArcel1]